MKKYTILNLLVCLSFSSAALNEKNATLVNDSLLFNNVGVYSSLFSTKPPRKKKGGKQSYLKSGNLSVIVNKEAYASLFSTKPPRPKKGKTTKVA